MPVPSVACLLLAGGIAFEAARFRARRTGRQGAGWTFAAWALRPWTAWSALSLVFRWQAGRVFNNPRTFPFFANLWQADEGLPAALLRLATTPAAWLWTGLVLLLLGALTTLALWLTRHAPRGKAVTMPVLLGAYLLTVALHLSQACLPDGCRSEGRRPSSLLAAWNNPGSTMLYCTHFVRNTNHYLANFTDIQPKLRHTIHGITHPPLASLSLHWIGEVAGAKGRDMHAQNTRLRYCLGLTAFSGLNVFLVYLLGHAIFGCRRTGLLAALLWTVAPASAAYTTFSQDPFYALFFNLALLCTWNLATARSGTLAWGVAAGMVYAGLALLTFSWTIAAAISAVFVLCMAFRNRWGLAGFLRRTVPAATAFVLLLASVLLRYDLDYMQVYRTAQAYVDGWYVLEGSYQWVMALIGGQFDLWLLLGSVTCSAFLVSLRGLVRGLPGQPRMVFLATILAIYAIPILFGPTCLKMETARCWGWIATVPLAFAASVLLRTTRPRLFAGGAVALAGLTYTAMRLFMDFGA